MQMALFLGSTKILDGSKFKHAYLRIKFYPKPYLYLTLQMVFFTPLDLSKKKQKFMMTGQIIIFHYPELRPFWDDAPY